jgi:intein/homing endonuclease
LDVERTNEGAKVIVHVTSMADNPMPEDYKKNEDLKSVLFSFRGTEHCFFLEEVVVVSSIDYDVVYISK